MNLININPYIKKPKNILNQSELKTSTPISNRLFNINKNIARIKKTSGAAGRLRMICPHA